MGLSFVFLYYYSLQFHSRRTLIKTEPNWKPGNQNKHFHQYFDEVQLCVNNDQMLWKMLVKDTLVIYFITLINMKNLSHNFEWLQLAVHQSQSQRVWFQSISFTPNACQMC